MSSPACDGRAAPEFLEQAAKELLEERWKKATKEKLPTPAARIG